LEVDAGAAPDGRVRRPGGGRKPAEELDPGLAAALEALVDPDTRGDPMSPLRWTAKSTRDLASVLAERGHSASEWLVRRLLTAAGYSLQGNAKTREGNQHPDRDGQFRYLNERAAAALAAGEPVISVDAKKKELVGQFKNGGQEWAPKGSPEQVNVHDFKDPELGKAIPYGVYDLAANIGWVSVGVDHDTAAFAVQSIRNWWNAMGKDRYPAAATLLISADGGGSNGYPGIEGRAGRVRRRDRAGDHRVPSAPRDFEMEQDRAPVVLPHHHELARASADQPRGHHRAARGDNDPHRAHRPRRARHRRLPPRRQDH
jgi:hypothetical protein